MSLLTVFIPVFLLLLLHLLLDARNLVFDSRIGICLYLEGQVLGPAGLLGVPLNDQFTQVRVIFLVSLRVVALRKVCELLATFLLVLRDTISRHYV